MRTEKFYTASNGQKITVNQYWTVEDGYPDKADWPTCEGCPDKVYSIILDVKTFETVDLANFGPYLDNLNGRYGIVVVYYSSNGGEIKTADLTKGYILPYDLVRDILDKAVTKITKDPDFARAVLTKYITDKKCYYSHILKVFPITGDIGPESWEELSV